MTNLFAAADFAYALFWLAIGSLILAGVGLLIVAWIRSAWRAFKGWNHRRRMRRVLDQQLAAYAAQDQVSTNGNRENYRRPMGAK